MDYSDEKIVAARREKRENAHKNIYDDEVWAGGEAFHFSPVKLFAGKLSIMLPDSFTDLSEAQKKIKYPMEQRPSIIKSKQDTSINFAFAYHDIAFHSTLLKEALETYARGIYRMFPGTDFLNTEIVSDGDTAIGFFDFVSKGIDTNIYQLFAFMPLAGKMLQLIFNSPADLMDAWRPIVLQTVASMQENRN
jgi:hypothetical protein